MKTKDLKRITPRYSHGTNGSWEDGTIGWFKITNFDEENEQIHWNCIWGNWDMITDLQGKAICGLNVVYPNQINEVYVENQFKGLTDDIK